MEQKVLKVVFGNKKFSFYTEVCGKMFFGISDISITLASDGHIEYKSLPKPDRMA